MRACLHGRRKILVAGRPENAEQQFVGFTCRNFGPCGAQVEKDLEGVKSGERKKKKKWTVFLSVINPGPKHADMVQRTAEAFISEKKDYYTVKGKKSMTTGSYQDPSTGMWLQTFM